MASGWYLGNEGKIITLSKGPVTIKFDRIIETGDGYVCAMDIFPTAEAATTTLEEGSTIDINQLHRILNHCGADTLKLTAAANNITVQGELKPCFSCKISNAQKRSVPKTTSTMATQIGERLYIDISSVAVKSY